jgi:predicted nuclease of predicted toxin-antitoxin system
MLRFVADENVRGQVIRGVLRLQPELDLVRAIDVDLGSTPDPEILEWAARHERILLTRDSASMIAYIRERIANELKMPGAVILRDRASNRDQIDAILLVAFASEPYEWNNRLEYLPWPSAVPSTS